jgi:hypothetical protein
LAGAAGRRRRRRAALLSDPAWARKVHKGEFSALKGFETSALAELD